MRGTIKTIQDMEGALVKMLNKTKGKKRGAALVDVFDPKKPKSVWIYVATAFPEWQNACVEVVRAVYDEVGDKVDDGKVRDVLSEKGLIKNKRAMPFVQAFKVGVFIVQVVGACLFESFSDCLFL